MDGADFVSPQSRPAWEIRGSERDRENNNIEYTREIHTLHWGILIEKCIATQMGLAFSQFPFSPFPYPLSLFVQRQQTILSLPFLSLPPSPSQHSNQTEREGEEPNSRGLKITEKMEDDLSLSERERDWILIVFCSVFWYAWLGFQRRRERGIQVMEEWMIWLWFSVLFS